MALKVEVKKDRLAYYLACLSEGKPLDVPEGGWTGNELLALAGVCFFIRMTHGPEGFTPEQHEALPFEHKEAVSDTLYDDLHTAIEWCCDAAEHLHNGSYDELFDPTHVVRLSERDQMQPLEGFRSTPDSG